MHTNVELFVCREVKFKVLHVFGCFVDDEPSCELSWGEPERVAGLTVQLKLCVHPASRKHINKQSTIIIMRNFLVMKTFTRIS